MTDTSFESLSAYVFDDPAPAPKPHFMPDAPMTHVIFDQVKLDDKPYVEAQIELEQLFDKNQRMKRIRKEFDIPEFHDMCEKANLEVPFTVDLCAQMVVHKRASASTLIGILYHHFSTFDGSRKEAMQLCAQSLEAAVEHDFVDYDMSRSEFVLALDMTAETHRDLDRYQYPLPMIVEPRVTKNNRQNGYLSPTTSKSLLVLRGEKGDGAYEENDICLDHLNRVNQIPLKLNTEVVMLIDNEWEDLDQQRSGETYDEYEKRVKAFQRYDRNSKDVIASISGMRDRFWLTHKYDRRGRVYCQGYHINYQGNPWNKAAVEFAEEELLAA